MWRKGKKSVVDCVRMNIPQSGREKEKSLMDLANEVLFCQYCQRRSPLSVCVCIFSIVSHVSSVKTMDFVAKTTDFWRRRRIFYFFFVFAKNPSSSPHCLPCVRHMLQCLHCILMSEAPTLSMCGHTNEGIPSTEHVHMLHWACADIIMRANPLTDMTDNTEDANTN